MSKTPKVGTSIIIIDEYNDVLIGERKGSHGEGFYSVPGGHVEHNEKVLDACYRELEEETGITREMLKDYPLEFVDFSEDFFPFVDKHYITMYYVVLVPEGLPVRNLEPDKCKEWKWINWDHLPENMFCNTYDVIQKYKGIPF